jgi:hypothetical protein
MMTDTRTMIDSAYGSPTLELTAAIDALRDCEQTCTSCAMAMVDSGGMVTEVRRALDCADLCDAAERVLSRGPAADPGVIAAVVEAVAVACEASAAACGAHAGHHDHCRLHSASAQALRALQQIGDLEPGFHSPRGLAPPCLLQVSQVAVGDEKPSTPPVVMTTLMSVDCWVNDSNRLPSSAIESKSR